MTDTLTSDLPHTVSRWKRAGYSLLSMLIALMALGFYFAITDKQHTLGGFIDEILGAPIIFGIFAVVGWLLSLPIILTVPSFSGGPRFWILFLVGISIGPIAMLVWSADGAKDFRSPPMLALGTGISFATSLIFLLLMRRAEHRIKS